MTGRLLAATAFWLAATTAYAEPAPSMTAAQFVMRCNLDHTWCANTVVQAQMIDAMMVGLQGRAAQRRYCLPKKMSGGERAGKIVKWLSRRPDALAEPISFAMIKAEKSLWPCGLFN